MIIAFTDYPITALGDAPGQAAPMRLCRVLSYDGNKLCRVLVGGVIDEIKSGYLYRKSGRIGEVPHLTAKQLRTLAKRRVRA